MVKVFKLFDFITTLHIGKMMINFILFIPTKCWLKAKIRGTKVSTNCSPSSSSAAFSMVSIRKSTNESSIWSVNRFKKRLKSSKKTLKLCSVYSGKCTILKISS